MVWCAAVSHIVETQILRFAQDDSGSFGSIGEL
jgi:hypothetical protein